MCSWYPLLGRSGLASCCTLFAGPIEIIWAQIKEPHSRIASLTKVGVVTADCWYKLVEHVKENVEDQDWSTCILTVCEWFNHSVW